MEVHEVVISKVELASRQNLALIVVTVFLKLLDLQSQKFIEKKVSLRIGLGLNLYVRKCNLKVL